MVHLVIMTSQMPVFQPSSDSPKGILKLTDIDLSPEERLPVTRKSSAPVDIPKVALRSTKKSISSKQQFKALQAASFDSRIAASKVSNTLRVFIVLYQLQTANLQNF